MAYTTTEYRYVFVSDQYLEWFGKDPKEVVGKTVPEILGEEAFLTRKDYLERCLKGEHVVLESQITHQKLGVRDTEQIYYPDINEKGEVVGILALAHDVTEKRQKERELRQAELHIRSILDKQKEKLYALLMQSPALITVFTGRDLIVDFQNKKAEKYLGRSILGQSLREAVPELEPQGYFGMMEKIFETGEPVGITSSKISLLQPDGTTKLGYLDTYLEPMKDEEGRVVSIFDLTVDVTDKVMALNRVEESQKLFWTYAESMPHMAFIASPSGEIVYFNHQWEAYLGVDPYKEDDHGLSQYVHPDEAESLDANWKESIHLGTMFEIETRLRRQDGAYRWHLTRAVPLLDSEGKVSKWMGTVTDIHDVKIRQRELEGALQMRDEFLSIASHELKTPLTSLKLSSQFFLRSLKKGDMSTLSRERLEHMANQNNELVSRLARLIDDMLDVSRIRTGRLQLHKTHEDLYHITKDVIERMESHFQTAGIETPTILGNSSVEGKWDRFRIEQALVNLISNAIRYGQGKPIELEVRRANDKAILKVTDHGYGIAEQDQERIFYRFERAIDASEVSGLGLGLFITKEIIKSHEGEIRVESVPGSGATFIVELPLK